MTNEVGYKKPPVSSRFEKGKSGNPKGRPRGSRNAHALLFNALNGTPGRGKITEAERIVQSLVDSAIAGDRRATKTVLDLIERYDHQLEPHIANRKREKFPIRTIIIPER